jgi:hypothetical protein
MFRRRRISVAAGQKKTTGLIKKETKVLKIPNLKQQISNKSQISIFNDQNRFGILNFGHCDLFGICVLLFEIF